MNKITVCVIAFIMLLLPTYGQELQKSNIENLLRIQGEITFNFKVNNDSQLSDLTNYLTIIDFDNTTKNVKAWANRKQFQRFQKLNIPFKVYQDDNDNNSRLMTTEICALSKTVKPGYTLEFPLKAYPTYQDYESQMQNFEQVHPDLVDYFSIGSTEEGDKEILFVKISDNISKDEAEPKLLYTSTMHGDELAGFPMMLNLIDYLITAYKDAFHPDHQRIFKLINESEIWINPNANPDGTYHLSSDNTSVTFARRGNANNVDLNRNYPDNIAGHNPDGEHYQRETEHFIKLANNNHFVIAANFHGGSELVNYPWDNTFERHPDDSWWTLTAGEYRNNAQEDSPYGYMDEEKNGITNGADWYLIHGSRQDYMNFEHQCKELTVELSEIKKPFAHQLPELWNYNKNALIAYLMQGTYGFRGAVIDNYTNVPIANATIKAIDHDRNGSWTVTDNDGTFYRPIFSGAYDLVIEAPNYQPIVLMRESIKNNETKFLGNIKMSPILPKGGESLITLSNTNSHPSNLDSTYPIIKNEAEEFPKYGLDNSWMDLIKQMYLFR